MARGSGRYNRTFSEEKWALVNPENKQILDDFLLEYRSQKKSPKTIEGYRQDLRIILVHIMEKHNNKSLLEMSKKDHRNVSLWLSEGMGGTSSDNQGRSNARVNRMRIALNIMMRHISSGNQCTFLFFFILDSGGKRCYNKSAHQLRASQPLRREATAILVSCCVD